MPINYVSDNKGATIAVQISIEDWKQIKNKYPDVDDLDKTIPEWQKKLIDQRLKAIAQDPSRLKPIDELFNELDKE
ncbi:MAG: addiction module protein [Chitinophagaceae bacterium]|nr:addiction module protein [Chitinophagaceae bacterium]